jgi:hypothetical protein
MVARPVAPATCTPPPERSLLRIYSGHHFNAAELIARDAAIMLEPDHRLAVSLSQESISIQEQAIRSRGQLGAGLGEC